MHGFVTGPDSDSQCPGSARPVSRPNYHTHCSGPPGKRQTIPDGHRWAALSCLMSFATSVFVVWLRANTPSTHRDDRGEQGAGSHTASGIGAVVFGTGVVESLFEAGAEFLLAEVVGVEGFL